MSALPSSPSPSSTQAASALPAVWVLTDGVTGHASQSLGVAEALGPPFATLALRYRPLAALPGALGPHSLLGLDRASREALMPPWPAVVIATGRRLGAVARWIKRRAGERGHQVRLVQIMDPVAGRGDFDLIAAPRHDRLAQHSASHIKLLETIGAPHRVTADRLAVEAEHWRARWSALPVPRIAVLVGGATHRRGFAPELAAELGRLASRLAGSVGGSLMATTSRRTGAAAAEALAGALQVPAIVHRWDQAEAAGEANPYFAFLGACDGVIVTGESVSMCSEACATGKPVYIFAPPAILKPAFAALHQELYAAGMARPLDDAAAVTFERWTYPPLSVAQDIAAEIRRRFAL